jgi:branched-subunit amino acid aminotransferase/4-amino-4-deoxychorismate lyase
LRRSLEIIGMQSQVDLGLLAESAARVAAHNMGFLPAGSDLGLSIFVTPGAYPAMAADLPATQCGPIVCIHTYRLPFHLWADKYVQGQALATTDIRQVPSSCWPAELKCRSRMHYYLADRQAMQRHADARALLQDQDGFVTEASTANVMAYWSSRGIVSPPHQKILPGISMAVATELAQEQGLAVSQQDLTVDELLRADEILLSSTTVCLLPVVRVNGHSIGNGRPGNVFGQLMDAWAKRVGLDIQQQALRFRHPPNRMP